MKKLSCAFAVALLLVSGVALASGTTPPTLPDGPVAGPPGWSCTASGGKVTCVRVSQQEK